MPFLPPNQQRQSTEGTDVGMITGLEMSWKYGKVTAGNFSPDQGKIGYAMADLKIKDISAAEKWQNLNANAAYLSLHGDGSELLGGDCCYFVTFVSRSYPFSALRCWLGGRKGIWPLKKLSGGCRHAYGPADATATHCLLLW